MGKISIKFFRIIGVFLFIWILCRINWVDVWTILSNLKLEYVLFYCLIFLIAFLLKILRLYWLVNKLGHHLQLSSIYLIVVESSFYGIITPARAGELTRVIYLKSYGLSNRLAWSLVLIERFIDAFVLLTVCIIGGLYLTHPSGERYGMMLGLLLVLIFFLFFALKNIFLFPKIINYLFHLLRNKSAVLDNPLSEYEDFLQLGKLSIVITIPCSLAILFLSFFQLTLLGLSLNSNISSLYLGFAYTLSSLFSYLPISIGGLGTREIVYISTLNKVGVSDNTAFIISLLDGLIFPILFMALLITPILIYKTKSKLSSLL